MLCECPHCSYELEVFDKLVGRRVKCPRCGERFRARAKKGSTAQVVEAAMPDPPVASRAHFLTRQVGVFIGGLVAVAVILGALVVRIYLDYQHRQGQVAVLAEARAEKEAGDEWFGRTEFVQARARYLEAKRLNEVLEVPNYELGRELDRLLETDAVKYLGQGWVEFRDEWMPQQKKEGILAQEQGLVEFDGKWVTPEEKEQLEAEKQKAEATAKLALEEASLRAEAQERGLEAVENFLRYAHDYAPAEAAERYMSELAGDPLEYPRIVYEYTVDTEVAYVSQDSERKHPDVSATYCGVKAYVSIGTAAGRERVVWNFQVRQVASEWKVTYAKQKGAPQLGPPPGTPSAPPPERE